jgi:hypothetical protein
MRRRGLLLAVAALALLSPARALAAAANDPVYNEQGMLIEAPVTPDSPRSARILTDHDAIVTFEQFPKVAHWLSRYKTASYAPRPATAHRTGNPTNASFDAKSGLWTVQIYEQPAGEIATGKLEDATGRVTEAWVGPQVAWTMARCTDSATEPGGFLRRPGCAAFGGAKINTPWVWLSFCVLFLFGLLDYKRLFSVRTLDLLMLVAPLSISLWFFNHGNIFTSVPFIYPTLFWVLGRALWIGITGRPTRGRPTWPTWLFVALTVFVGSFRVGINLWHSNVIDVGYAGVVGAERIATDHRSPYANFPKDDAGLTACGVADGNGYVRRHVQTNGNCEDAIPQGDTYGPVAYEAYIPGYALFGWSGFWDTLPAAHFTSLLFDTLCLIGLALLGLRFGGPRMASILAFAWVAYPFTQYTSSSNTNDSIGPAFLIFGLWLAHRPAARGMLLALAGWTKFAPLLAAGLWLGYPSGLLAFWRGRATRLPRTVGDFVGGFIIATTAAFSVVLFEPSVVHALWLFWHRTIVWQSGRDSPFSLWDWKQYHAAGIPDLHRVQQALQALLVLGAVALAFVPRRRSPLQLVAFTAALLVGFESVMTYWLYTYVPWFYGAAAAALLLGSAATARSGERREEVASAL